MYILAAELNQIALYGFYTAILRNHKTEISRTYVNSSHSWSSIYGSQ